jgi:DeoR/GlpR family transcriptional regulator of sugar metabolism
MLKEERHRRILELLEREGRLVAADLPGRLGVSGHTVRRDLDELADASSLQRVHGGALARSPVASTYEGRQVQSVDGCSNRARW